MNNKTIFFIKNILKKMLLLLVGITFTAEIANCAIRTTPEVAVTYENVEPNTMTLNQKIIKRTCEPQAPELLELDRLTIGSVAPQPDKQQTEEEIGSITFGQIVDIPKPITSRYEDLDWWFSVLSTIQQIAKTEPEKTYTEIVDMALNQRGLIYKSDQNILPYFETKLAEQFGISATADDFETAFDKKIYEFRQFSINDFTQKIDDSNQEYFQKYRSRNCFFTILQKKDLSKLDGDYTLLQTGDVHGDLVSLLVFLKNHELLFNKDFSLKDNKSFLVFTGDFIDRGQFGLEVLFILLSLKIKNPDNVYLSLGNHETSHKFLINLNQGFAREIARKFNFGEIEFFTGEYTQTPSIIGPGAEICKKFMYKLETNVFKYLPSALFFITEFGHITFCHGVPNVEDKLVSDFLLSSKNQIGFINTHPELTSFINNYICIPGVTDFNNFPTTSLESLGSYMNKEYMCLIMRGHQHSNATIGATFNFESDGGVIHHQTSPTSHVFTTSSHDITIYNFSKGIGNYAHFCQIQKEGSTLNVQGMTIDRHNGNLVTLTDRENSILKIPKIEIDHEQIDLMLKEIKSMDIRLRPEFYSEELLAKLQKRPPFYYFNCIKNLYHLLKVIQPLNKINFNGIYDLLISLKILDLDHNYILHKLKIESVGKCSISNILSNPADGIFTLIDNIKSLRMQLVQDIIKIRTQEDQEDFVSAIEKYITSINHYKNLIIKHLFEILELLGKSEDEKKQIITLIEKILGNINQNSV